jgi:aerobic carbon-monoxide dehydrogenase small subunit
VEPREPTPEGTWVRIRLKVDGREHEVVTPPDRRLVHLLRDDLGLPGTKYSCEVGVCGVCTVLVDGVPSSSCLALAGKLDGTEVLTVAGLAADPRHRRLQETFVAEGGFQCGFCTSGQLVGAAAVLDDTEGELPDRDELAERLHGHLCRCTGYYGILRAIEEAAR